MSRRLSFPFATALVLLLVASLPAFGEEWGFLGARYQGMGGAGVAVVNDEHASYWNPGALAFGGRHGVALPVSVQAAAEGTILRDVDEVATFLDGLAAGEFDQLIDDLQIGNALSGAQLATALELAAVRLPGLDEPGEGLITTVNASLLMRHERVAITGIGQGYFGADPVFDRVNLSLSNLNGAAAIDQLINPGTAMDRYAPGLAPGVVADLQVIFTEAMSGNPNLQAEELVFQAESAGVNVSDPGVVQAILNLATATASSADNSFADNNSGAFIRGLAVEEVGVAYGHPLPFWGERIGLGANLKYMYGTTFNKFVRYNDIDSGGDLVDELTSANNQETTHTVSLDLGLLVKPYDWLHFGLTARNVTSPEFNLARDPSDPAGKSKLTLDPQVRAGAAIWVLPNWVVAFDADLTKNESELLDGYESQIVSLGTEFGIPIGPVGLALRAGAYVNAASNTPEAIALTGGLGLEIFGFNLDLAVGASPKTEEVEAVNDQTIPSRLNASVMISYRQEF
ncbi:MAG: conjugal transfer protein TraF [Myxococcota bacterium]